MFVENLDGKFRNGYLNQHWFRAEEEVIYVIDLWQEHYSYTRLHSWLNYLSSF